jgi:integrase
MPKFTRRRARHKPKKPHPDFPLFAHNNGSWAKKIGGKLYYFGAWHYPQAALDLYLKTKDDLYAGRKPPVRGIGETTLADLCNTFLNAKDHAVETGGLSPRTRADYGTTCDRVIEAFGKDRLVEDLRPEDFEQLRRRLPATWGPNTVKNFIVHARVLFAFAVQAGLIASPVRYGPFFKLPSARELRRARNQKGPRMLEPAELRRVLSEAGQPLKAMIYLGLNCGFGNSDCGNLPESALELDKGWIVYARPKTEVVRRCPLWPETVEALREALANRPKPRTADSCGLAFVTIHGNGWAHERPQNPISQMTVRLLKALGLHRDGLGFYTFRHIFQTVADEARDPVATSHVMGHVPRTSDMSAVYRERISDERLRAVTDHVRQWLFGQAGDQVDAAAATADVPVVEG